MTRDIVIKTNGFSQADIRAVAALHVSCINGGFLSSFGPGLLELLYDRLAAADGGVLVTAVSGGEIIGFVSGTMNTKQFYAGFIKAHFLRAGFVLLPRLFSKGVVKKVFETLLYPFAKNAQSAPQAELISMALKENCRGTGTAQLLFEAFAREQQRLGVVSFRIVAGEGLVSANSFYAKMGAVSAGMVEVHGGAKSNIYVYNTETAVNKAHD